MPHPCYEWRDNEAREVVGEFNPFETKDNERDRENEQPADGIDGINHAYGAMRLQEWF